MIIKGYNFLSNWLSWVILVLMMGISPIIQAATDCNAVTEISKGECESLLELYNSTDGANWKDNSGWNVTNTPCSWYGVTCASGGVYQIFLKSNNLKGTIPNFSSLPNLEKLYMFRNQLSGTIPNFNALPNLTGLYLNNNQLTGTIPNFNALPNLRNLFLTSNKLTGTIPNFNALPKLTDLYLSINELTGTIPNFNALPNLLELFLDRNQLTGTIHNFNALPNLQELHLHSNQLTGTIPNFNALPNLQRLYLENNQLTGTIHNFNALPNLQGLYLYNNKLTGTIPNFNALPKLEDLSLHSNKLTGTIPNFNALPKLNYLALGGKLCKDKNTNYGKLEIKLNAFPYCPTSEPQTHTLSISSGNGGSISGSTKENYNSGDTVNLTANPNQCYKFTAWGGDCNGSSTCQLTMDTDKSVTANFEIQSFQLNISSDNGNVERQPNKTLYNCGETVKLTAKPNQDYKFKAWNGDANGSNESITVNMDANKNITAIFEPVASKPDDGGGISTNDKYAIIIAASGAHKQNTLFPYSNDLALRMYRTLFSRGYKHENIIYMNPQKWQDLHGSGRDTKIVDYELFQPQQELEKAFNTAANATKQFIFYIHGHAQKDSLQINREYWLSSQQLQQQLNKIAAEQIIIIDTCYSGSFIDNISGTKRTILTSSDAESRAWNNSNFSETLIPSLRRGNDIKTAFLEAVAKIESKQVPQLDDDGDGVYSSRDGIHAAKQYINQEGVSQADAPQIIQIHDYINLPPEQARAVLWIKTSPSGEAIKKARATLIPPSLQSVEYQGEKTNFGRTQLEMIYNPAQDRYEVVYNDFRQPGEWKIKYQVQGNEGFWSDTVTGIVQAAGVSTPVTIQISFNQPSYQIGEQLRINIKSNGIEEQKNYDLYLAIIYPQGFYQTITSPFNLSPVNTRQAYQSELNLSGEQNFSIPQFEIPTGWEKGKYFGCGVIMTAKGDPWESTSWISFECKEFNLR